MSASGRIRRCRNDHVRPLEYGHAGSCSDACGNRVGLAVDGLLDQANHDLNRVVGTEFPLYDQALLGVEVYCQSQSGW
jgi:hypothetical protein